MEEDMLIRDPIDRLFLMLAAAAVIIGGAGAFL